MIKKNLTKVLAISFCMSALLTGMAYADNVSPAYGGTISTEKATLHEMQKEMDQYLFVENVIEIEKKGFEVVYTGVSADEYVEVGISPYTEENAEFLYNIFGKKNVKVVAADEVVLFAPDEMAGEDLPVDSENVSSIVMDMGDDIPVSDINYDDKLISEREKLAAEDGGQDLNEELDDLIRLTGIEEDLPAVDIEEDSLDVVEDADYMTTQDDAVKAFSENAEVDRDSEKGSIMTAKNIAIAVGVVIVLGGVAFLSSKKKEIDSNK